MHAFMCPMYVYMCVYMCECIHAHIAKGCITLEVADRYLYSSHDSRYTGSHRTVYRRRDERGFFIKARRSDQNMSLYQPSARFFTLLMAFPDSLRREKKTHCRRIGVLCIISRPLSILLRRNHQLLRNKFFFSFFLISTVKQFSIFLFLFRSEQFQFCTLGLILITNNIVERKILISSRSRLIKFASFSPFNSFVYFGRIVECAVSAPMKMRTRIIVSLIEFNGNI